jgi:hypothetical protein
VQRARSSFWWPLVALAVAALWHLADRGAAHGPALRDAVLDLDAHVALQPRADCAPRVASADVVAAGAAPRLDAAARFVWFEADAPDGRRQVHRFERATRALACLTCCEAGENRRPAPHPTARAVVFDTDRFASWRRPFDRELMVLATDDGPARPSRRLTWGTARDSAAIYDPSGLGIAWSRHGLAGRAVRAPIRLGHGSLSLGRVELLARGGFAPVTPLAWSPDARALAFASGVGPLRSAEIVDYGAGASRSLPAASAFDASVSFSADGALRARAEHRAGGTRVWLEASEGDPQEIALGALAAWGEPTGVALAPRGDAFALGQRSAAGAERIVWAQLSCPRGPAANEQANAAR